MFRCQELNAFTLVMLHKAIDFFLFPQTSMKTGYMGSDMNFFEAGSEYDCIIFDLLSEYKPLYFMRIRDICLKFIEIYDTLVV